MTHYKIFAVPERTGGAAHQRPTGNIRLISDDEIGPQVEICVVGIEQAFELIETLQASIREIVTRQTARTS